MPVRRSSRVSKPVLPPPEKPRFITLHLDSHFALYPPTVFIATEPVAHTHSVADSDQEDESISSADETYEQSNSRSSRKRPARGSTKKSAGKKTKLSPKSTPKDSGVGWKKKSNKKTASASRGRARTKGDLSEDEKYEDVSMAGSDNEEAPAKSKRRRSGKTLPKCKLFLQVAKEGTAVKMIVQGFLKSYHEAGKKGVEKPLTEFTNFLVQVRRAHVTDTREKCSLHLHQHLKVPLFTDYL